MNIRKIFFFLSITISSIPVSGQVGGNNTYEFLNLPVSARVSALGGNIISTRDNDLNLSLNNPALLSDSMDNNVALSYVNYFTDVKYGYVAYGKHIKNIGNFSAGINYLDYGTFTRADETGAQLGTFTANEMSLNIGYAHTILDSNFNVGATLKTVYSHLDSYTSWGSAIDLGASYIRPSHGFGAALVIKNVGVQWKKYVQGNKETLPFEVQIGISKKPKHIPFRFSITYENLEKWDLTYQDPANPVLTIDPLTGDPIKQHKLKTFGDKFMRHIVIGGEFLVTKNFFLRAGYNYQRRKELIIPDKRGAAGFSFGFGFKVYKFHFSYAHAVYHIAGPTNTFSISFDVDSFHKVKS